MLKSLFRKAPKRTPLPRVPDDVRVYAIGDIHGCDVEFADLLAQIDADHTARMPKRQLLILLGDLIDRGPDSAGVVERVCRMVESGREVRMLGGNHEELLLRSCENDTRALRLFAQNGGRETALSYGIKLEAYNSADFASLARLLDDVVPEAHRMLLNGMEDVVVVGDYAFVHAGIHPDRPLADQRGEDLRWIRDRFLLHRDPYEKFIVHGHTITPTIDEQPNRLGIDTGAFASGRLTAVALEGDRRWFLQTAQRG